MATLTIRDLDDALRAQLRVRAASHGRSMEAEVREILRLALAAPLATEPLGARVRQRFADIGSGGIGIEDLELPSRSETPRTAELPE